MWMSGRVLRADAVVSIAPHVRSASDTCRRPLLLSEGHAGRTLREKERDKAIRVRHGLQVVRIRRSSSWEHTHAPTLRTYVRTHACTFPRHVSHEIRHRRAQAYINTYTLPIIARAHARSRSPAPDRQGIGRARKRLHERDTAYGTKCTEVRTRAFLPRAFECERACRLAARVFPP